MNDRFKTFHIKATVASSRRVFSRLCSALVCFTRSATGNPLYTKIPILNFNSRIPEFITVGHLPCEPTHELIGHHPVLHEFRDGRRGKIKTKLSTIVLQLVIRTDPARVTRQTEHGRSYTRAAGLADTGLHIIYQHCVDHIHRRRR